MFINCRNTLVFDYYFDAINYAISISYIKTLKCCQEKRKTPPHAKLLFFDITPHNFDFFQFVCAHSHLFNYS